MLHCPICYLHRKYRNFRGFISWWWNYKVLKKPEPNFEEVIGSLIPATFSALIGLKLGQEMQKEYEKAIEKSKLKVEG